MTMGASWPTTQSLLLSQVREFQNKTAWNSFVEIYAPLIFRFCRKRGLQDADAHDVTQEVFKQVSRTLPTFEYDRDRGKFRGWLGKITRHEIERFLKKNSSEQATGGSRSHIPLDLLPRELEANWADECKAYLFELALSRTRPRFSEEVWQAFETTWLEDRSPQDVAQQLQRSPAWIYKARFKVLNRLQQEVEELAANHPIEI